MYGTTHARTCDRDSFIRSRHIYTGRIYTKRTHMCGTTHARTCGRDSFIQIRHIYTGRNIHKKDTYVWHDSCAHARQRYDSVVPHICDLFVYMCPLCVYASCVYMPTSYERVSVARARVRRAIHMCPPCVYVSSLHERVMSRV